MTRRHLLTFALILTLAPAVSEARRVVRRHGPTGTFQGAIASVAGNSLSINTTDSDEKMVSVWTDDKTTISAGDKPATLKDLKPGLNVTVKAANGHATSITVDANGDGSTKDKKDGSSKEKKEGADKGKDAPSDGKGK